LKAKTNKELAKSLNITRQWLHKLLNKYKIRSPAIRTRIEKLEKDVK